MLIAGDLLGERASLTPDRTALVYVPTGERFTYAQLDARAVRLARVWRGLGIAKGDRVALLAVAPGGEPPAAADLTAFLEGRLARYKVPRDFVFLDALPRTPYGKVVKGELRDRYLGERKG